MNENETHASPHSSKQFILEEPDAGIYLHEKGFLEIRISHEVQPADYKFTHEHALLFAQKENIHRILIDESQLDQIGYRSRAWLMFRHLPHVFKTLGFQLRVAILRPSSSRLTGISNKAFAVAYDKMKATFRLEFFEDRSAAEEFVCREEKILEDRS